MADQFCVVVSRCSRETDKLYSFAVDLYDLPTGDWQYTAKSNYANKSTCNLDRKNVLRHKTPCPNNKPPPLPLPEGILITSYLKDEKPSLIENISRIFSRLWRL